MTQWLRKLALWLGIIPTTTYAYPALDIHLQGGIHLHLVGSIHMGTENMTPLPAALIQRLKRADALIVEADITQASPSFDTAEVAETLESQLSPELWQQVLQRCQETGIPANAIQHYPAWRTALTLQAQQAHQLGLRSEYGIDYQMLRFAQQTSLKTIELEGADTQMALLHALPDNGIVLLKDTLAHWHTNARLLQTLIGWWISPTESMATTELPATFSDDLYQILMGERNHKWQKMLLTLPAGNYVVAVGALHLYSEGNLPELLAPYVIH
ncbi:conjugal transfer protein TraB [Obesumbacterium proteus]|uniref:TraB/GumN family protein n=2 Tax=Hafniaceae TaxID=1903412 RepID=UPI0006218E78|nr:TraB/GumN family protein [Obesumbacterium proteus]KKI48808.1 conjugal transfer protein TraB [Obesumbacterium proteus]